MFLFISYRTLLEIDKEQVDSVLIGITIKPTPVRDKVIQLDVVAILTNVSNDFNNVVITLYSLISFLIYCFCFCSK